MDFKDKTARLRRTFRYAADQDSDSDSQPEAMDEQGKLPPLFRDLLSVRSSLSLSLCIG